MCKSKTRYEKREPKRGHTDEKMLQRATRYHVLDAYLSVGPGVRNIAAIKQNDISFRVPRAGCHACRPIGVVRPMRHQPSVPVHILMGRPLGRSAIYEAVEERRCPLLDRYEPVPLMAECFSKAETRKCNHCTSSSE